MTQTQSKSKLESMRQAIAAKKQAEAEGLTITPTVVPAPIQAAAPKTSTPTPQPVAGNGQQPPAAKKPKPPKLNRGTPRQRDAAHDTKGRLPDGATFHAEYDAKAERWTGTLTIPGEAPVRLEDLSSGVFRLMANLDNKYRRHLEKAAAVDERPEGTAA